MFGEVRAAGSGTRSTVRPPTTLAGTRMRCAPAPGPRMLEASPPAAGLADTIEADAVLVGGVAGVNALAGVVVVVESHMVGAGA